MFLILTNQVLLLYIFSAMICTWIVQMHSTRYKKLTALERMRDSFICSLFTAVVCLPLFDYFPNVPYSVALPIGAVVGTIGFGGWEKLANTLLDIALARYNGGVIMRGGTSNNIPEDNEPPMPIRRRRKE